MQLYNAIQLKNGAKTEYNRMSTLTQPIQFLPREEKDDDWTAWNLDWLEWQGMKQMRRNARRLLKNYKLAKGIIDRTDYIVEEDQEYADLIDILTKEDASALELKFYPIIPNVINVLVSEFAKRNTKVSFRTVDERSYNELLEQKRMMVEQALVSDAQAKIAANMLAMGANPEDPEIQEALSIEKVKTLPEIEQFFKKDYRSMLEEWAEHQFRVDEESKGEKYISADIARLGKDRTVICVWHGLHLIEIHELRKQPITTVVTNIRELVSKHSIRLANVICDEDGVGGGVVDTLKCRGFLNGGRAKQPDRYVNQKAECYFKLAELIEQNKVVFKVDRFRDVIVQELDMIRRRTPEADGKLAVISKDEIARMHGKSPDYADAIMMRMYFELFPNYGSYSWA